MVNVIHEDDLPGVGHNSEPAAQGEGAAIAKDQLRSYIGRVERLESEKDDLAVDIREVYAEAKGNGFDTKILRRVVRLRKQDAAQRQEENAILDLYLSALGML